MKNNIGKGGIKDFFKGGESKKGGLFEKGGDKYPPQTTNCTKFIKKEGVQISSIKEKRTIKIKGLERKTRIFQKD